MGAGAGKEIAAKGYDSDVDNELGYKFAGRREMIAKSDESGGQFTSSTPWAGAIFPPENLPEDADEPKEAPQQSLVLEHIYGYRGHDCRDNVFYGKDGEIIYFAAAAAIVYDPVTKKQSFYLEHDDDIVSMAPHHTKNVMLTGQLGKDPKMCLWDWSTKTTIGIIHDCHSVGIQACSLSPNGNRIVSLGMDTDNTVCVHEVHGEKIDLIDTQSGGSSKLSQVKFITDDMFVTVGKNHVGFWRIGKDGKSASKRGIFGPDGPENVLCLSFIGGKAITGDAAGNLRLWDPASRKSIKTIKAHQGPIFCVNATGEHVISVGKDGRIVFWNRDTFEEAQTIDLRSISEEFVDDLGRNRLYNTSRSPCGRSLAINPDGTKIVVGTLTNELFEIEIETSAVTLISEGHAMGEAWGIASHPTSPLFVSCSQDRSVRLWDRNTRQIKMIRKFKSKLHSVAFSPDSSLIAIGTENGTVIVLNTKDFSTFAMRRYRKEMISDLKFSPDGTKLAVASHDNFIDILESSREFKRSVICKGHSSFVTHIDWSADGDWIQSNSGDYELLFWNSKTGDQMVNPSQLANVHWDTWTCVLGWPVKGIWPTFADGTDINAVCRSRLSDCLVTCDDFGMVNLFEYPCNVPGSSYKKYPGHSAHVACCCFSSDDSHVYTIGGADTTIFQWINQDDRKDMENITIDEDVELEIKNSDYSHNASFRSKPIPPASMPPPEIEESDEEEEADDDKTEIDGEVIPTKPKSSLNRAWFSGNCPWVGAVFPPDNASEMVIDGKAPSKKLELVHAFGYRAHDSRDNLFFLNSGEIVYSTAAVAVVHNLETKEQKFYLGHTDDIVSLAVHPNGRYVATGQVGSDPLVIIWDSVTMKKKRTLTGFHQNAVCSLGFSPDGKRIVSVGADTKHSIAVWDWRRKKLLSNSPGHSDKIVSVDFNSHDETGNGIVSCGINHIKFWKLEDQNRLSSHKGVFGKKGSLQTIHSISFIGEHTTIAGTQTGDIYKFEKNILSQTKNNIHKGSVVALHACEHGIATGGKEGKVKLWTNDLEPLEGNHEFDFTSFTGVSALGHYVRSVAWKDRTLIVGMMSSEVYTVNIDDSTITPVTTGLGEGEVWGVDTHPTDPKVFVTASEDCTIRVWNIDTFMVTQFKMLDCPAFVCRYSSDATKLVVGCDVGQFYVLDAETLDVIISKKDRQEEISDCKFSPDGNYLAVGSHDNFVDIYDVNDDYSLVGTCKGHSSYITHLDWSADSKFIVSNCGAYEILFWSVPDGSQVKFPSKLRNIEWASYTCVLGWPVQGIWPKGSDGTDMNTVDRSYNKELLAVADDFGNVKLLKYPCVKPNSVAFFGKGHSAHVTNVRFFADDEYIVTTGGNDRSVLLWKVV